jgi:signal transduction histidine kinase
LLFIHPFFGYHKYQQFRFYWRVANDDERALKNTFFLCPSMNPSLFDILLSDPALLSVTIGLTGALIGAVLGIGIYNILTGRTRSIKALERAKRDMEKARQSERERVRSIYELISSMTTTLQYRRVLDMALDLGGNTLAGPKGPEVTVYSAALLFSNERGDKPVLTVGSSRRFTPADLRIKLPGINGALGRAISRGEAAFCKDITRDPELRQIVALRNCQVAYCLPLRTGLNTYGVLLFAHPDTDFFTLEHREILDIIAQQAVIALQNATLYNDLEQEKERMMEIQEEARKKLSRDLHDGPTQSVAAIAMRVNFVRRLMERNPSAAAEELYKIEDLARRTTKEIRHMLFTLRPLVLESQGLQAALEAMAEKMRDTYEQNVLVEVDSRLISELEMGKQTIVFYIIEEAVNNARKYAKANNIWVRLKELENGLALLEVQDDGVGFDVGEVDSTYEHRGSLGLVNMRERAELVNGLFQIHASEGQGTRVDVFIPLNEAASDRLRRGQ